MSEPSPPPRPRRRRLRRTVLTVLAVVVVLPTLTVLAILAALRAAGVRQAVLGRVSTLLAEDYGLAVTAKDFSPLWRRSGVELRDVRLGAPGAAPLATARRVRAEIVLGTLRTRPLVVRSLEADGLRIDLAARFPELPESPLEEAGAGPPVEIRRILLRNAEVRGAPPAKPAADWLRSWSARGIDGRGSYRGGRLELEIERGLATLDRPDFGLQELRLTGRVGYEEKKPLRIDGLRVTGDGLLLTASGTVGLEEGATTAAQFDFDAEPRALAAGLPPRGRIRAAGQIALPKTSGQLKIAAEEIPVEALRPYLDPNLYGDLALAGTVADVEADVVLGPGDWGRVAGTAAAAWRRDGRSLVQVQTRLLPGDGPTPVAATVTAELLPGSPGRRSLQGTIRAASWGELAQAAAEAVRAEVRLPDVRAALAEVRALWPRLVPAPPPGLPIQGSLTANARLSGSVAAPDATVDAAWLPRAGSSVRIEAKGRPRTWSGTAKVRTEALPLEMLGALAPGLAGTVTGTAELSGSPSGYRTRVEAAAADLALPPSLQRLESGTVTADGTVILRPLSYRGTLSLDGAGLMVLAKASDSAQIRTVHVETDGLFRSEPFTYTGKVTVTGEDAEMAGAGRADRLAAVADGMIGLQPLTYDATLSLDASGVEAPGTARVDHLRFSGKGQGTADLRTLAARGRLDADRVVLLEQGTEVRNLHVEAEGDGREAHLTALSGELPEGRTFDATGRIVTQPLLAEADLDLRLVKPVDAIPAADLTARLRHGVVDVEAPRIDTASGPGRLRARVPLGALQDVPQIAPALESLKIDTAPGPISLSLAFPELDSEPLLASLGMEPRPERVRTGVTADLSLDLAAPAAGQGEVRLAELTVTTPDGRVAADGPAVLRLADGRLDLEPVHLRIDGGAVQGAGIDLRGSADLARSWNPWEDAPAAAVTRISAEGSGTLDAALLNPYLQGGAAEGSLAFSAKAAGPPDRLAAEVSASGPGASFVWPAASLRVEDPRLALDLRDGLWTIRDGRLGVNGGSAELAGGFSPAGALDLEARLRGVHYRLDYGIETLLSGRLALRSAPEERTRLSGQVTVDRGVLDRDINLDREVFTLLFKPPEATGTGESALAAVDLDVKVETTEGVRIKNNVGDLRASWRTLTVGGTLESPIVRGRIDIDPDGRFYAYGQTVRIDRGSLLFTGDPVTDPQVELVATTSLQDPTIAPLGEEDPFDLLARGPEDGKRTWAETQDKLAEGLASYYGDRVLQRLAESVSLGGFSVRPVLVFNEGDPSARLTVGRDLSSSVSLALSVDLRNAERQTYLLDVHELRSLPGLRFEGFTNDAGHEGTVLQQAIAFGGGEVRQRQTGPRLRRLEVSAPKKGISRSRIRRAIGLRKREAVPEATAFAVEVDVADFLRRKGYPDPRIEAAVRPVESRPGRVDVAVAVEPGPKVSFLFHGDKPPRSLRPEITGLYRTDFYEPISIEEMRQAAVRAFRAIGHLEPKVEIEVRRERPADPDGPRVVTLRTEAGRRLSLEELAVPGLKPEEERLLAGAFPSLLARAELAAGLPAADARLLNTLHGLAYPEAKIGGRAVEANGSRLVVNVEPGRRRIVAEVEVAGADGEERQRLLDLLPLRAGDPARVDRISQGALLLERDLRERGHADTAVRSSIVPAPGRPSEVKIVYAVDAGPRYVVAGVEVAGERWSRRALLLRETGLAAAEPFTEAGVEEARNRLFGTGIFSRVDADVERGDDGAARVSFSLAERPRFHLRYGVRWENEVGTAAVVDFVDQNFLGRAITLGLRGLYQTDDRSGRLYLRTGGVLGTRISLESYAEERRRLFPEDNLAEDRREAALQASRPFGESATARLYARYRTTHLYEIEPNSFFPLDLELTLPYLGAQLQYDTRDDSIDPVTGLFASADVSGSGPLLGSDFKYVRLFAQAMSFRDVSLAGRPWTWAQAVRVGLAHSFGEDLVPDERFRAGGPYSVRGYELESLGPRENLGDFNRVLGGEALLVVNEELRFALPWDLTGLVFFDAGQVWTRPGDADFDLAKSLGLGLRARSPLGLLRLDAAYPLDRRRGEPRYKLYLGFGNAF
jgi:translocation and assembly module TamA